MDHMYKTVKKLTEGGDIISVYKNNYMYRANRRGLLRRSLLSKCNNFSLYTRKWSFIYAQT